jgi:hypothetical protein
VYATDRAVLKEIMTAARAARKVEVASLQPAEVEPTVPSVEEDISASAVVRESDVHPATAIQPIDPGLTGDALFDEVMADLNRLQNLKKVFENSFTEFRKTYPADGAASIKPKTAEPAKRSAFEKSVTAEPKAEVKPKPAKTVKPIPTDLIPEPNSESLLNEIETSRKKVFPDSKKQKEQLQIIDQFISKQPSIGKAIPSKVEGADLTEKSASLTDSMVSETLVEILLRQGKKDKAIEVLRKLIWKFPQKKAIFAAQIEDLRK